LDLVIVEEYKENFFEQSDDTWVKGDEEP